MKKCKLLTPCGKAIVGIKGEDGKIIPCAYINRATDDLGGQTVVYQVPDIGQIPEKTILIDQDGGEWSEIDIWDVST